MLWLLGSSLRDQQGASRDGIWMPENRGEGVEHGTSNMWGSALPLSHTLKTAGVS